MLRRRGHRVVFIIEESFEGTLEAKGFEERLMRLTPLSDAEEDPGQFWKDFIRDTAPVFRTSTKEQLEGFIAPTYQALIDGAKHVDRRLAEIIDEVPILAVLATRVAGGMRIEGAGELRAVLVDKRKEQFTRALAEKLHISRASAYSRVCCASPALNA